MRILVIQHDDDSDLGTLGEPLIAAGAEIEAWTAHRKAAPNRPIADYDGVIVLGGIVNPDQDDEHAWLATERFAMETALGEAIPLLGVCLGGQLLAQTAGGTAGKSPVPEVGWFEVESTPALRADRLFGGFPDRFTAFEWHHYRFELPPGSVLLARNGNANQAFRVGENAWGIQFHIEASGRIVREWLEVGGDDARSVGIDPADIDRATNLHDDAQIALCRQLGERFADVVAANLRQEVA